MRILSLAVLFALSQHKPKPQGRSTLGLDRGCGVAGLLGRPGLSIPAASILETPDEIRRGIPG